MIKITVNLQLPDLRRIERSVIIFHFEYRTSDVEAIRVYATTRKR